MQSRKLMFALGSGLLLTAAGVVNADTATSNTDLQAEVAALRAEVKELKGQQSDTWLDQRRADEVKALVKEVLADADTRASLLETGATAGHNGKNFFLASEDGNFLMKIDGQIQVRYVYNRRDNNSDTSGDPAYDENESGFSIRRAKVQFSGHIVSPQWFYALRLAVSEGNNDARLEKAIIGYEAMDGLKLWAGEDKAPFLREELISSSKQLTIERSLVNELFTTGYTQGVGAVWTGDMFKVSGMINDGARAGEKGGAETFATQEEAVLDENGDPVLDGNGNPVVVHTDRPVDKYFDGDATDFAITARADVKVMGDWESWDDFQSWNGQETSLFIGGAVHYEIGETGDNFLQGKVLEYSVDASFKMGGFGVYVAGVGAHFTADDAAVNDDNTDIFGIVAQASYLFNDKIEPFIRYEWLDVSDLNPEGAKFDDHLNLVTLGANYYFAKHNAKLQLDLVYAFNGLSAESIPGVNVSGMGLAFDSPGEDGQVALRAQFQLLF